MRNFASHFFRLLEKNGPTWVRTRDLPVMSRWLFQLSYGPSKPAVSQAERFSLLTLEKVFVKSVLSVLPYFFSWSDPQRAQRGTKKSLGCFFLRVASCPSWTIRETASTIQKTFLPYFFYGQIREVQKEARIKSSDVSYSADGKFP